MLYIRYEKTWYGKNNPQRPHSRSVIWISLTYLILFLNILEWTLITLLQAESLWQVPTIKPWESSTLMLVRVEKSIMASECKSKFFFFGWLLIKNVARIFAVSFTQDNHYVLSGSEDMNIRIWKARASEAMGVVSIVSIIKQLLNWIALR